MHAAQIDHDCLRQRYTTTLLWPNNGTVSACVKTMRLDKLQLKKKSNRSSFTVLSLRRRLDQH